VLALFIICHLCLITPALSDKGRKAPVFKVWISKRTDGRFGNGTEKNPYDGSTSAKFDALMQSIPASTHIHLGPGTFYTQGTGSIGINPKEGWIIEGAGKLKTTIAFNDGRATGAFGNKVIGNNAGVRGGVPSGYLNYFSVRNLTIDTNKANQPVFTAPVSGALLEAIRGGSNNAEIINVRALGIWNGHPTAEGFPFNVEHDNHVSQTNHILFEGCEVIDPQGYHSAISAFGPPGLRGNYMRVTIKNCKVTNHLRGSCFSPVQAIHTEISNNYAYNSGTGSTMDTGRFIEVHIFKNRWIKMHKQAIGMSGGGGPYENVHIHDNYFEMDPGAKGFAGIHGSNNPVAVTTGLQIYGNTIIQRSRTARAFAFKAGTTGSIRDNIISEGKASDLSRTHLVVSGNCTPDRVPLSLGVRSRENPR
jgi:hypothetical protein